MSRTTNALAAVAAGLLLVSCAAAGRSPVQAPQATSVGLSAQDHADLTAYILQANGFPAGDDALGVDTDALGVDRDALGRYQTCEQCHRR